MSSLYVSYMGIKQLLSTFLLPLHLSVFPTWSSLISFPSLSFYCLPESWLFDPKTKDMMSFSSSTLEPPLQQQVLLVQLPEWGGSLGDGSAGLGAP